MRFSACRHDTVMLLLASRAVPGGIHHSVVVVRDLDASLCCHRDGLCLDLLLDRHVEGDWPALLDAPSRRVRGAGPVIANVIPVHTAQIMERSTPIRSHCQHERWPCQIGNLDPESGRSALRCVTCPGLSEARSPGLICAAVTGGRSSLALVVGAGLCGAGGLG